MARQFWTAKELDLVRTDYRCLGAVRLAQRLDRTPDAVRGQAARLGLAKRHRPTAYYEATIHRLHAQGFSDTDIARKVDLSREAVTYHRRRLGLPNNLTHERQRRKVAAGVRQQCKREGCASLTELRWQVHRVECLRRGWPAANSPRQCDVLDILMTGPMTKRQIQMALGLMPGAGGRQRPWVYEMLRTLRRLGLVVSRGRIHQVGGRGRNQAVYALAPGVSREFRPARLAE